MQLNTAYPSGAYLTSFFKTENCEASWCDLNIRLFYEIFSAAGLRKLFELSESHALQLADQAERKGDDNTALTHSFPTLDPIHCSMYSSNYCF